MFFMRVSNGIYQILKFVHRSISKRFFKNQLQRNLDMHWKLHFSDEVPRMAIFVSKLSHCLYDILSRYQSGEWKIDVPLIISNHPDLEKVANEFNIDYHFFPITQSK